MHMGMLQLWDPMHRSRSIDTTVPVYLGMHMGMQCYAHWVQLYAHSCTAVCFIIVRRQSAVSSNDDCRPESCTLRGRRHVEFVKKTYQPVQLIFFEPVNA